LCSIKRSFPYLSTSSYLSAIERRVENVEETLQSLQRHISGLSNNGQGKSADPVSRQKSSELQEVVETNDSVDGMGALVFANEEESGFFGKHLVNAHNNSANAVLITDENRSFF
jgi:hypothetical protein